eukprot:5356899-Pleurochrysis_carterae.AAC.1
MTTDQMHPIIGSRGISRISSSISLDRCKALLLTHFGGHQSLSLLSYPTLALHTFLASKPLTQLAISRHRSQRYRDQGRLFVVLTSRPEYYSFDYFARLAIKLSSRAPFIWKSSHRMRTCGALAPRSPGSGNLASAWPRPPAERPRPRAAP